MEIRVGIGQDSHKLKLKTQNSKFKTLIIGGVEIGAPYYFEADSDGDVVLHALCNALSSAVGGGSLSSVADFLCQKGITDSSEYVKIFYKRVKDKGFLVNNVSICVEAGKPKLESYGLRVKKKIGELLEIKPEKVGITFTSGKDLTGFGKGEGIQAIVVVAISRRSRKGR